jgi:hypothetical protein
MTGAKALRAVPAGIPLNVEVRRGCMKGKMLLTMVVCAALLCTIFTSCSTIRGAKTAAKMTGAWKDLAYESKVSDFEDYQDWMKINDEPVTGDEFGVLGEAHEGAEGFREIYINDAGKKVSKGKDKFPYPGGTIIVKESYSNNNGGKGDLNSLTVMIKRATGYDVEHGNWEYMMVSPDNEVMAQGRLEMCISCHSAVSDSDWVFSNQR